MAFIIAFGIEVIITSIAFRYYNNKKKMKEKIKNFLYSIIVTGTVFIIVIGVFGLCFNIIDEPFSEEQYDITNYSVTVGSNNIVALQDGNQVEGRSSQNLFLGSGRINEKMYYCCYIETENGYQFYKISPEDENVYVKYCDKDEQPRIEQNRTYEKAVLKEKPENSFWYSLSLYYKTKDMKIGDVLWDREKELDLFEKKFSYTIYVPKGSIVNDYKIDMHKE